ncbi:hypothetical protein [Mycobacterium sp. GA-2829]|uniref:hypothetical protein n=1 Tax=Mycobacterium sp. GA-2829 TaxID=1772283 RepID=UPI0007402E72|nr:hypothetical protein [Mycobacterium sp. GA-2829]KUI36246.1 hypothetical protein AU194_16165 [Mycobacterium sp. GA-2829]
MTAPKQPPPGVETTPEGPVVSLREAAAVLGKDPRTLKRAITAGEIRGGASPRPERLRWYVYASELESGQPEAEPTPPPTSEVETLRAEVEDLRAQVVSLTETNRLLIAAQQDVMDADRSYREAADKYRAASQKYLDALTQFMTPGHLGDLANL